MAVGLWLRVQPTVRDVNEIPHVNAGLIDEFSIALSPVLFGSGIRLFEGVDAGRVALEPVRAEPTQRVILSRSGRVAPAPAVPGDEQVRFRGSPCGRLVQGDGPPVL